ncbi:alanine dehydrogenase [Candidatus Planktophila versatilis]|uniref:alanine dehydrogenase n=1 Tax=Candidatus Planktophila versatilis TaxID=1884905 RepID=UPI000BACE8E2|nr:alanine dehydrogenase [Candidatus Planktophila versatilis]ASY26125.1 alanine dehydrogenase [Candidatus Planktophila versatilis]
MRVGIPKEVKNNEFRVSTTAAGVHALVLAGHTVFVEKSAGVGSAITDAEYEKAGATILATADEVWTKSEMIIKVKEPIAQEYPRMRKGQILFTYLHLAASRECTDAIIKSGITAIAYETVEFNRTLPLLAPMSEVAGRMSIQVGATALQSPNGGRGVLLGGVPGVAPGKVVILGGGSVGVSAASMAVGLRADVTLLDINLKRLAEIDDIFQGRVKTIASSPYSIEQHVSQADLVIGGVLIPGAAAPKLVTDAMVAKMKPGSVLVDVAIDQGGCFEGSRATTHADPTFKVHNSLYYCVANMPGAVPATSTAALSNATLKYSLALANKGWQQAISDDAGLAAGLNVHEGEIRYAAVAAAHA